MEVGLEVIAATLGKLHAKHKLGATQKWEKLDPAERSRWRLSARHAAQRNLRDATDAPAIDLLAQRIARLYAERSSLDGFAWHSCSAKERGLWRLIARRAVELQG
jgi:hypothetical protein